MSIFTTKHDLRSIKEHLSDVDDIRGNLSTPNSYNDLTQNTQRLKDVAEVYSYDDQLIQSNNDNETEEYSNDDNKTKDK